jgi:UDP-N-acetylmuramate--alanine ligase
MDLSRIKKAYFIGIKGVGMTALAQVLKGRGIEVLGSDNQEKFFTDQVLKKLDVKVIEGFDKKNVPAEADLIIASAAYLGQEIKNPEVAELKKQGRPVFTYAQVLGRLFKEKKGIAVAGTHGKSTITAMLGLILEEAGFDPTVIVGSRVIQWQSNARVGQSEYLVAEADEYRNNFLHYSPQILVLSSLEYDHPDFFKDFQAYQETFRQLVRKIPSTGFIIANSLDSQVREIIKRAECRVIEYGRPIEKIKLKIPGQHNLLNAAAAAETALKLGIDKEIIKKTLANFQGISRRFEIKGRRRGVLLIDDYAHHPTEIKATLAAAKDFYPGGKIWAVFQPHTFSRTKALLDDFAAAFDQADQVIVLDIYGSAREKTGQVKAEDLVEKIRERIQGTPFLGTPSVRASLKRASLCHTIEEAAEYLKRNVLAGQIILTMGAGDVWQVLEKIS